MQFYVQQFSEESPGPWAAAREAEGWHGFSQYDHVYLDSVGRGLFHPWAVLGAVAAHTTRLRLTTAFSNNLLRSPVDVAHAALTLQLISAGRFDVGVGAGWSRQEVVGSSLDFPPSADRARRFKEAVLVIRQLLNGACSFEGEFYRIDLPAAGPRADTPPRLMAALGGAWTLREIGPLVDSIELATMGKAGRDGQIDWATYGQIEHDDLQQLVDRAREANPTAPLGLSVYVATGRPEKLTAMARTFGTGVFHGLVGEPGQVADRLLELATTFGFDRITVLPPLPNTAEQLAEVLFC